MKRRFIAILACRNKSNRLYAKPLQNLDQNGKVTIIDFLIKNLKKHKVLDQIALAISNKPENKEYIDIAKKYKIGYVLGDDKDVLSRLIKCAKTFKATDVLRITSESPFPYLKNLEKYWLLHKKNNFDATFFDNVVDGCGYEILKTESLKKSYRLGISKHKSELCTLFMRENVQKFNIKRLFPPKNLFRIDIRLTVDNPEDLILCKKVYRKFKNKYYDLYNIIKFIDKKPDLKKLIKPFCSKGYKSMYKWKK